MTQNSNQILLKISNSKGFEDMVSMEIINDAELLLNLAARYRNNLIFTYVGPTLLVINPFQPVPALFKEDSKSNYIKHIVINKSYFIYKLHILDPFKDMPAHIYATGA